MDSLIRIGAAWAILGGVVITQTFEMKSVRSRVDGFIVGLTQPAPYSVASKPANHALPQYRRIPASNLGGPQSDVETLTATRVDVSQDRRKAFVPPPNLKEGRVVEPRLKDFMNHAPVEPWAAEARHTPDLLPVESGPYFVLMNPPEEPASPVAPAGSATHEAEDAVRAGPVSGTAHTGYTGTGYADYGATVGETITWTIPADQAGPHWISFRYANGDSTALPLALMVNGVVVNSAIPFGGSGAWTTWIHTEGLSVNLLGGMNTIRLTSTINSGPNVDHLYVCGPPVTPPGAVVLFDGTATSLENQWKRNANGAPPNWPVSAGAMAVAYSTKPNDISTITGFRDFRLHVEWLSPPGGTGQEAGNSGVYLQRSYEIQVLNTPPGETPQTNTAGAIYGQKSVDVNASLGAGVWQSYDVDFTAARWNGAVKIANARASVRWNGMLVHDDVAISGPTGASPAESPGLHPLLLQAHSSGASGAVRYRNVWVIPKLSVQEQWASWLEENNLEGADQDSTADPDADGMTNLWEYASGGDPTTADLFTATGDPRTPRMSVIHEAGERYIEFTFVRRAGAIDRGLDFESQTSPTMGADSWTFRSSCLTGPPVAIGDGSLERVILRVDESVAGSQQLFARLKAGLRN